MKPYFSGPNMNRGYARGRRKPDAKGRARLRMDLFYKTRGLCHYCDAQLNIANATIDHIVPRVLGGTWLRWNLTIACRDCNEEKSDTYEWCWCWDCVWARWVFENNFGKEQLVSIFTQNV